MTITDVEMPPDLRSARVYFSCLGGDASARSAAEALRRAAGFLRREVGQRCQLRYAPELHFLSDRSLERGARIEELLAPGPAPAEDDEPDAVTDARVSADPRGLPLPPRQAGGPDLARRRRARAQGDGRRPHRPQRHARSDGDGPAAALRRRRRAAAGLLHADGQVLRGHDPARAARRRPTTARARPSGPTATPRGVTAGRRSRRRPQRSAASSSSRRRPTRPRRSAAASSTRWRARARAVAVAAEEGPRLAASTFGDLADGRLAVLDLLLVGHLHPLDRERARREARLRRAPGDPAPHAHRRLPRRRRRDARALRGDAAGRAPGRRPTPCPLARVPFPFPRVRLASLEAWKVRRGQADSGPGRLDAREGDWVTLLGPGRRHAGPGAGQPDRRPAGSAMIKPRIVLAEPRRSPAAPVSTEPRELPTCGSLRGL